MQWLGEGGGVGREPWRFTCRGGSRVYHRMLCCSWGRWGGRPWRFTCRGAIKGVPQLEAIRVLLLEVLQLRPQQDVILSLSNKTPVLAHTNAREKDNKLICRWTNGPPAAPVKAVNNHRHIKRTQDGPNMHLHCCSVAHTHISPTPSSNVCGCLSSVSKASGLSLMPPH